MGRVKGSLGAAREIYVKNIKIDDRKEEMKKEKL